MRIYLDGIDSGIPVALERSSNGCSHEEGRKGISSATVLNVMGKEFGDKNILKGSKYFNAFTLVKRCKFFFEEVDKQTVDEK